MVSTSIHHPYIFLCNIGLSMLVYGGQFQNGALSSEMLNFDL